MNCKPGDLAIAIRSKAGNEGRIFRCIRFVGSLSGFLGDDYWLTDQLSPTKHGDMDPHYRDSWLRPIRDPGDDARDETLDWLPSPAKETA
jgi:hypothetical protein